MSSGESYFDWKARQDREWLAQERQRQDEGILSWRVKQWAAEPEPEDEIDRLYRDYGDPVG